MKILVLICDHVLNCENFTTIMSMLRRGILVFSIMIDRLFLLGTCKKLVGGCDATQILYKITPISHPCYLHLSHIIILLYMYLC